MKPASLLAVLVFFLVAVAHLLRLVMGVEIVVGGVVAPMWISGVGLVFAAALAVALGRESGAAGSRRDAR